MIAVSFLQIFNNHRILARMRCRRKAQIHGRVIDFVHFQTLQFFQLLDARLHLHRLGSFVTESFNKGLGILNHFLLILVTAQLLFTAFFAQFKKLSIRHFIIVNLA